MQERRGMGSGMGNWKTEEQINIGIGDTRAVDDLQLLLLGQQ